MPHNKEIGNYGESVACRYLNNQGYRILEKNYRTKLGEIDIIARDGKYVVFIEVKTRRNLKYGYPREAVDTYKQSRIIKIAYLYLAEKQIINTPVRFDVVEIIISGSEDVKAISLFKNAFQ